MAERFRTRQAIADLTTVARRATVATLSRLADHAPAQQREGMAAYLVAAIAADGRITGPVQEIVRETALLAASLPDQDYDAFCAATALILADGLHGGGEDNMYWHWDAYQAHYALAGPVVRAAILQGYLIGAEMGRFKIDNPPPRSIALSEPTEDVQKALRAISENKRHSRRIADGLIAALAGAVPASDMARLWSEHGATLLEGGSETAMALVRGFRHVYERSPDFVPDHDAAVMPPLAENRRDTARLA